MYKNVKTDPNQSLFYSAAPQYGQRIRVTRMQRQQVRVEIKIIIFNENGDDDDDNDNNISGVDDRNVTDSD